MVNAVTHAEKFHTDDVFAGATLQLVFGDDIQITRSRDPEVIANADIAFDIGAVYDPAFGRFDHHQENAPMRENGYPYSSFGLVWKEFGETLCGSKRVSQQIENDLVVPIDCIDNGVGNIQPIMPGVYLYIINNIIHSFRPKWDETQKDYDGGYFKAVAFAKEHLQRVIAQYQSKVKGEAIAEEAFQKAHDKRVITFDAPGYPFHEVMANHPEVLFVMQPRPRGDGSWGVEAISNIAHALDYRLLFPEEWAGKRDQELAEITGVSDAIFCHKARYLCVAGSKEGALKLAHLTIEKSREKHPHLYLG